MKIGVEKIKMDKQGRVILPRVWRAQLKTNNLYAIEYPAFLKIVPREKVDLTELFGIAKADIDPKIFGDWHKFKSAAISKRVMK